MCASSVASLEMMFDADSDSIVGAGTGAVVNIWSGPYTIGGAHWIVSIEKIRLAAITRK
jgi:hypothetical protein